MDNMTPKMEQLQARIKILEAENRSLRAQLVTPSVENPLPSAESAAREDAPLSSDTLDQEPRVETVSTLVGGIAHDFNNLLAGIMGNIFLLLRQAEEGPQRDRLRDVQKMCQDAADMTAQMLIFSRRNFIQTEALQLHHFMHDFSRMCQVLIPQEVCFEMGEVAEDLIVQIDVSQFQQILINLLINAQEALGHQENPTIGLSVEAFQADEAFRLKHPIIQQDELVCLSVIDNGCGIPQDLQEKIFTPFFTTKKNGQKGTGLGLSMVAEAVKQLHGATELISTPGQGTIIRIYLPREKVAVDERRNGIRENLEQGQGQLLLLADDDDYVRESHKEVLTQLGYRVLAVADGRQAVEAFEEYPQVVLAILDVAMPKLDGVSAGRQIRRIRPDLPILFMTGYADRVLAKQTLPTDAEMLNKPAAMPELSHRVHRLLAESGCLQP